jgi:hypothetical protein
VLEKSVLTGATVGDAVMLPTVGSLRMKHNAFCSQNETFFSKSSTRSDRKQIAEANVYLEGPVLTTYNSSCHVACHK